MKKIIMAFMVIMLSSHAALAAEVFGNWTTPDKKTIIKISKCSTGVCGVITKATIKGSKDIENEDPKLRNRPIKGLQLFSFRNTNNPKRWDGKLYNARDGKTYTGVMKLLNDNTLKLEGCVLMVFCKGEEWSRI